MWWSWTSIELAEMGVRVSEPAERTMWWSWTSIELAEMGVQ
jgi:hypothetical protein